MKDKPFAVGPYVIGGNDRNIIYDDDGTLGEDAAFTWDKDEKVLTIADSTRATIDVLRGSTPHPAWNYGNHLVFIAGQESTGGGTICAVAHAHDDPTTSNEFTGYRSGGTLDNPTAVKAGSRLTRYAACAFDGVAFGAGGMLDLSSGQDWSQTTHCTYFTLRLCPQDSVISRPVMAVDGIGTLRLPLATGRVEVGQNAATIGAIGLPNNSSIAGRSTSGTNITMMYLDKANAVRIGSTQSTGVTIDAPSGGIKVNGQSSGAGACVATIGNAPSVGDPKFWLPINIAGVVRYLPCW